MNTTKACWCVMAGTTACKHCQNYPTETVDFPNERADKTMFYPQVEGITPTIIHAEDGGTQ